MRMRIAGKYKYYTPSSHRGDMYSMGIAWQRPNGKHQETFGHSL